MKFLRVQDFDPAHIRRIFSPFSAMRLGALTTRPSCPLNTWLTPAIVTTGRGFHHQPPSLWTLLAAGFEPGITQMWSRPAIVTTRRVFRHQPPSLWTFLAAGLEPGISGVYLVCSPPKLGALTTRPSCCPKKCGLCQP